MGAALFDGYVCVEADGEGAAVVCAYDEVGAGELALPAPPGDAFTGGG